MNALSTAVNLRLNGFTRLLRTLDNDLRINTLIGLRNMPRIRSHLANSYLNIYVGERSALRTMTSRSIRRLINEEGAQANDLTEADLTRLHLIRGTTRL